MARIRHSRCIRRELRVSGVARQPHSAPARPLDWFRPSHPPVQPPADPSAAGRKTLRLDDALQLLEQSGQSLPDRRTTDRAVWLQAVVDGLCELSSRDPLTGLFNRRHFELTLASEIDRVARAGEPAMVLMVDIDHFKRINDAHGHTAGDGVIRAVAQTLHDCIRPMDTVARVGGEEFAMILPNCAPAFGQAVAERIRMRIADKAIALVPIGEVRTTVSIGGAFAPQWVRSSPYLWVERADQQLYRAKSEGRNRVCLEHAAISHVSAEEKGLLFGTSRFQDLE